MEEKRSGSPAFRSYTDGGTSAQFPPAFSPATRAPGQTAKTTNAQFHYNVTFDLAYPRRYSAFDEHPLPWVTARRGRVDTEPNPASFEFHRCNFKIMPVAALIHIHRVKAGRGCRAYLRSVAGENEAAVRGFDHLCARRIDQKPTLSRQLWSKVSRRASLR